MPDTPAMSDTPDAPPLACVPGAIPATERAAHFALVARLFRARAQERRALADGPAEGYAFRFDAEELPELARFVANERRCCPFLTFALELPAGADVAWLRLTGPVGTRAFLDAELGVAELGPPGAPAA